MDDRPMFEREPGPGFGSGCYGEALGRYMTVRTNGNEIELRRTDASLSVEIRLSAEQARAVAAELVAAADAIEAQP